MLFGEEKNKWLVALFYICLIIGVYKILMFVLGVLCCCGRHCCRFKQDLYSKYAKMGFNSYAVVTGGTDGFGLEFCHQLAD